MRFPYRHTMTVAAHRGDSHNYYENTMEAFEKAVEAGCDMIETDIRMTSDGHLVLFHDENLFRVTGKLGKICEMTLEEVRKVNVGNELHPLQIPTLDEFLAWSAKQGIWLNLELKEYWFPGNEERCRLTVEKTIELVRKYGLEKDIILNSFDAWPLEYADETYNHEFLIHGFYPYHNMKNVNRNPDEYLYCACICGTEKDKSRFDYLLERGIEPWVGAGVTSSDALELAVHYGAKLITTNCPGECIEKLKGLGYRNGCK